jgi:hypothetical protein
LRQPRRSWPEWSEYLIQDTRDTLGGMECLETCPVMDKAQQDAVIDATIKAAVGHRRPKAPINLVPF